jgi:hypothetical protein
VDQIVQYLMSMGIPPDQALAVARKMYPMDATQGRREAKMVPGDFPGGVPPRRQQGQMAPVNPEPYTRFVTGAGVPSERAAHMAIQINPEKAQLMDVYRDYLIKTKGMTPVDAAGYHDAIRTGRPGYNVGAAQAEWDARQGSD